MERQYLTAEDIQEITGVKQTKAYAVIKELNKELEEKGIFTISGRVSKRYLKREHNVGLIQKRCVLTLESTRI